MRVICYTFYSPRSDALISNYFEDLLVMVLLVMAMDWTMFAFRKVEIFRAFECSGLPWFNDFASEKLSFDIIARWRHWCYKFVEVKLTGVFRANQSWSVSRIMQILVAYFFGPPCMYEHCLWSFIENTFHSDTRWNASKPEEILYVPNFVFWASVSEVAVFCDCGWTLSAVLSAGLSSDSDPCIPNSKFIIITCTTQC